MTWTTPRTWTDTEVVTAAMMNTHVRDNIAHLYPRLYDQTLSSVGAFNTGSVIPSTVRSVTVYLSVRSDLSGTGLDPCELNFNSDTTANYDYSYVYGSGTTFNGGEVFAGNFIRIADVPRAGDIANAFTGVVLNIAFHNAGDHKRLSGHASTKRAESTGELRQYYFGGTWRSTAAITSIQVTPQGGSKNFAVGSRISVYGAF